MKFKVLLVVLLALVIAVSALAAPNVKPGPRDGVKPLGGDAAKQPKWWGPEPNQTPVAKGTVANVGPDQITLNLPQGVQTFAVTPKTEIMVAGKKAGLADIRQGDPCMIRMQLVPTGFPIALAIRDRPVPEEPRVKNPGVAGVVAEVAADHIALNTPKGPAGFVVNAQTEVIVFGKKASIGDVKAGMRAEVVFRPVEGGAPVALRIGIAKPRVEGMVTEINGNVLTVRAKDTTWMVTVPPTAKIFFRERPATLDDIRKGFQVVAMGELNGNSMVADTVQIMPAVRRGVVTAVNGSEITIATVEQMIITGQLSDQTVITVRPRVGPNRKGSAADIKVESPVNVGGIMVDGGPYQGGTMQLMFVDVLVAQ